MEDDFKRPSFPDILHLKRPSNAIESSSPPRSNPNKRAKRTSSPKKLNPNTTASAEVYSGSLSSCSFSNLWVDEFAPKSWVELVIHKKKIAELREWLTKGYLTHPVLLLKGPTGSGKSTTLSHLAADLGLHTVEWTEPVRYDALEHGLTTTPITQQFTDFLLRGTKYASPADLFLVKNFPLLTWDMLRTVQTCMERVCAPRGARVFRLVFVFSEFTLHTDLLEEAAKNVVAVLTPSALVPEPCMPRCCTIRFNPVARTYVKKALELITYKVSSLPSQQTAMHRLFDAIIEQARGDLKHAVHLFQLNCVLPHLPLHLHTKDLFRTLFEELGHVLYNKRDPAVLCAPELLPPHLQRWARPHPIADYAAYLARIPLAPSTFARLLHANLAPFFPRLAALTFLAEQFAAADTLHDTPHVLPVLVLGTALAHAVEELWDMDLASFWPPDDLDDKDDASLTRPGVPATTTTRSTNTFLPMFAPPALAQRQREHRAFLLQHRLRATETNFHSFYARTVPAVAPPVPAAARHDSEEYFELDEDPIEEDAF